MTTHEFNNDSNRSERQRVERDTYLSRAQAEADQVGGRFKKEITTTVNAVPVYPSLPASSPWSQGFDQNLEPALGFSVDQMPAVGTEKEIRASLEVVGVEPPLCADDLGGPLAPTDAASPSAVETGPPKPDERRE